MIDFRLYDKRMTHKNKGQLKGFAKSQGYMTFSEMIYRMHKKNNISARAISDFITEETRRFLISYNAIQAFIRDKGWLNKNAKYRPPKRKEGKIKDACVRCGKRPKKDGNHWFCSQCQGKNLMYGDRVLEEHCFVN